MKVYFSYKETKPSDDPIKANGSQHKHSYKSEPATTSSNFKYILQLILLFWIPVEIIGSINSFVSRFGGTPNNGPFNIVFFGGSGNDFGNNFNILLVVILIAIQVFFYRYIGSSWERLGTIKKIGLSLFVIGGPITYTLAIVIAIIPVVFLIATGIGPTMAKSQRDYNRTMRNASTRADIRNISDKLDEISRKL